MYTKFHDNTIETKFIKQLVATTNVPFISTWRDGQFAVRGMFYIYSDSIWRCNHTGYPSNILDKCQVRKDQVRTIGDSTANQPTKSVGAYSWQNTLFGGNHPSSDQYIPYFTKIKPYIFGEEYIGITGKYTSKTLGYDATTHFYLGQYLRMMRDLFGLDLMPFYNCYCGETISDVDFDSSGVVVAKKHSNMYKIMSVPVRFGKTYTIALNSELPVETVLAIYGEKGLNIDKTNNLNDITGSTTGGSTYQRFQRLSFSRPNTLKTKSWHQLYNSYYVGKYGKLEPYDVSHVDSTKVINDNTYDQALGQYEKYLRLLIKVPKTNTSSLVVIEGDYNVGQTQEMVNTNNITFNNMSGVDTTINSKTINGDWVRPNYIHNQYKNKTDDTVLDLSNYNDMSRLDVSILEKLTNTEISEKSAPLISPLGLLQVSDGNNYAFSNRLIEYLLQHVINHLESFDKNISRVQTYAKSITNMSKNGSRYTGAITAGVWDDNLKKYLFELAKGSLHIGKKVDLTGYVDKDVESVVSRGQGV